METKRMLGNKKPNAKWMAIAAVSSLVSATAFAQQATQTTTTTAKKSTLQEIQDRVNLSYTALFYGPSVGNPLNDKSPTETSIDGGDMLKIRNIISTAYVFENGWNIGPVIDFDWIAVHEHGVNWRNPFLKFQMPGLLRAQTPVGELSFTPDARLIAPVSQAAQGRSLLFGVASKQNLNWSIGNSPFSLSLTTYMQYNQYSMGPDGTFATSGTGNFAGNQDGGGSFLNYFGILGVNYQAASWAGVFAALELDGALTRKNFALVDDGIFVDIGASFNPIAEISITPFIEVRPKNPNLIDGTSMHLDLTFNLL
jgi:hypothetical protein